MFGKKRPVTFDANGNWLLATGQPSPDLNCAFLATDEGVDQTLFNFLRRFEKLRVPFLICMVPEAAERVGAKAEKLGLVSVGELPLMVRGASSLDVSDGEIRVMLVRREAEVEAFQRFASEQFGLPGNILPNVLPPKSLASGGVSYFLGFQGEELCGVGATTRHDQVVGIWSMVTAPERRRQGVGRAIIQAMLGHHVEAKEFFLLATTAGEPLYRGCGFTTAETGKVYAGRFG